MQFEISERIHSFCGGACEGNAHYLIEVGAYDNEYLEALSWELGPAILVAVKKSLFNSDGIIKPKFFHNGKQVQFCGSGLLAMMHYLAWTYDIQFRESEDLRAELSQLSLALVKNENLFSYKLNLDLVTAPCSFSYWQRFIDQPIERASMLGKHYIVLELSSAKVLRSIQPNLDLLRTEDPAMILTAEAGEEFEQDYVMRYFAPQFGNPEDAATGSANAYLMKYWHDKLGEDSLSGRQLSKQGGLFYGQVNGSYVALSGQTR